MLDGLPSLKAETRTNAVGTSVGDENGAVDGASLGATEGTVVGIRCRAAEGLRDPGMEEAAVGDPLGYALGDFDREVEGIEVGAMEGL